MRIASLSLLALCLAVVPATAQVLVNNGPINGTTDAWTINFGFIVSDSFSLTGASTVSGLAFGAWVAPGDTLQSAEVSISSSEFGGTTYFDNVVNFTQSGCSGNQLGYNVCTETSSGMTPVNLAAGSYWLNLQNANSVQGNPIYWDENSGPASASQNDIGTIPSEAFTLYAAATTTTTTTSDSLPEPTSITLLGSGAVALAGVLRRKLS